ncbi:MAG: phosphohistidine phosphatase SixA [Verrucomicrobiota bacterium]|jgi:phosphohistidine phosphatase
MQLILLRHGKAGCSSAGGDFFRELEEKGHEQARHAARILAAADLLPDLVLSSPVIRAKQTAISFTTATGMPGPIFLDWLSCGMSPETALAELGHFPEFKRIMIVGHEPDFSRLVSHCLGGTADIEVRKGSVTCIDLRPPAPRATLRFLIPHKLAKHL